MHALKYLMDIVFELVADICYVLVRYNTHADGCVSAAWDNGRVVNRYINLMYR